MRSLGLALTTLALAACASQDTTSPSLAPAAALASGTGDVGASVFTLTNQTTGNAVRAFNRAGDGSLTFVADYTTGGTGTGAGLGSQAALAFGRGQTIVAVNAGSNDVSVLAFSNSGLQVTDRVASGGTTPISIATWQDLVYVLNAGTPANITGFRQDALGRLTPIANSTRSLSTAAPAPAQLAFSPNGRTLVVTEKGTNSILTFAIASDDTPGAPVVNASAGQTPFGFSFTGRGDYLVVSEAFGGAANGSASSSYRLGDRGQLSVRTASLSGAQTAACWIAITPDGQFAYATNTGSLTITGYRVGTTGMLALLGTNGVSGATTGSPIDAAITRNGRYLYVLASSSRSVDAFAIAADGSLTAISSTGGLMAGTVGLLAR